MKKENFTLLDIHNPFFKGQPSQLVYVELISPYGKEEVQLRCAMNANSPIAILIGSNGSYKTTMLKAINEDLWEIHKIFYQDPNTGYVLVSAKYGRITAINKLGTSAVPYCKIEECIDNNRKNSTKIPFDDDRFAEFPNIFGDSFRNEDSFVGNQCGFYLDDNVLENQEAILRRCVLTHNQTNSVLGYFEELTNKEIDIKETELSRGERKLLNLLIACIGSIQKIILIDEIGNSFHISWQEDLANKILPEIAKKYGKQIIYTTHSPSMLGDGDSLCEMLE